MSALSQLNVSNVTCIRGERVLFRDLSFSARAGEAVSIEGPNGAGKTSLLRMVAGFLAPASGTITISCERELSEPEERGLRIGWVGHRDGAKPQLTPAEVLTFFANLYGNASDVAAALFNAGLERCADLPCQYLSAGQKKRLALARLNLWGRAVWLLDEPLAALDSNGKKFAADLIAAHCARGGIALWATHEPLGIDCQRLTLGEA